MTQVSADQIKQLRETTGAGILDCRKALIEAGGDMEAATTWLRKKGLAAAAKKSGRVAAEGVVAVAVEGTKGAIIELNSETDFVARNEQFQQLAGVISETAVRHSIEDVEELKNTATRYGKTVIEGITWAIANIGENINLRRSAILGVNQGVVASYVHNAVAPGMGKIGILIALESTGTPSKLEALGKQLAMHIAAANPSHLEKSDLSAHALSREEEAAVEQAAKFIGKFHEFETAAIKYKDRMGQERAFSEKILETKLAELSQTIPNVDELLNDYATQSQSDDRKEKQNAEKTKKLLDIFFQEAAYLLKKIRSYGDEAAMRKKLAQLKIERFLEEAILHEQIYVIDGKTKISQVVANAAQDVGAPVKITGFVRFQLGEGVEKQQSDFAAEVAAAAGTNAA